MEYKELPKPIPASEAIKSSGVNIKVPDGTTLRIGPFERQYAELFRIASVDSFSDLHTLGFIPRELREEQVVQAFRLDERAFREATLGRSPVLTRQESSGCSCGGHASQTVPLRRHFQNNLIDLLQPAIRDTLTTVHPMVAHTYHHTKSWLSRRNSLVAMYSIEDVYIGDHATLTNTPTVQAFFARNIEIGKEGRLQFLSGSVKVRCSKLTGPTPDYLRTIVPGLSQEFVQRSSS